MKKYTSTHPQAKNISGQRFGRLLVLDCVGSDKNGRLLWRCRCNCGNETVIGGKELRIGHTQSCGCLNRETMAGINRTHGKARTKLYKVWKGMKARCTNTKSKAYANYGGRGIKVCDEWLHDFQAFFDHVTKLPHYGKKGYSLDRIDNDGNYEPGNVRWSTRKVQNNNTRPKPNAVWLTFNGKTQNLTDWAKELGINKNTLEHRYRAGWSTERMLTAPVDLRFSRI